MASTIPTVLLAAAILVAAVTYFRHDTRSSSGGLTAGTHLHFYMHDQYTGAKPTAAVIVLGRPPLSNATSNDDPRRFGDIAVMNNALTEGPGRGSVNALSMHLVVEAGEHASSSLVVSGRVDTDLAMHESVVVGGIVNIDKICSF